MRVLHVVSPMMRGQDVHDLQVKLKAIGLPVGPIDGQYGPATRAAVEIFQKRHHLHVTGAVDAATVTALKATAKVNPPAPPAKPSPGLLALAEAAKHIGVTESPYGSNKQPFGAWFGMNGVAWCNIFMSYCFKVGAGITLGGGHGAGCYPHGIAYVPTTEGWLRSTGQWVGKTTPAPGDIAIFNWDGGEPDHIGIVEKYVGGGQFQTIEGNTAVGNDSNGGEVMRRERYVSNVDGFGRIKAA